MPWFRIVVTVAAIEPSLFMPPRIKIRAISRRPSAETDETSAFIALSVFIASPALVRLCDYQHLRPQVQECWKRKRDLHNCNADNPLFAVDHIFPFHGGDLVAALPSQQQHFHQR